MILVERLEGLIAVQYKRMTEACKLIPDQSTIGDFLVQAKWRTCIDTQRKLQTLANAAAIGKSCCNEFNVQVVHTTKLDE